MQDIYLLHTRHKELGKCTSSKLYDIFERIKPDKIFEEIPQSHFEEFYVSKIRSNLESVAINSFTQASNIRPIPVDFDEVADNIFFERYEKLHEYRGGLVDISGYYYRSFIDRNRLNVYN